MATDLKTWAHNAFEEYKAKIAALMGIRPSDVKFVVETGRQANPAWTKGNVIHLSAEWFKDHPNDKGAIVHEAVHAFLGSDSSGDKFHEQLADFVRGKLGLARESSKDTAAFFTWIEGQRPGTVRRLAQEMADGSYSGADFKNIVGINYENAQQLYQSKSNISQAVDTTANPNTGPAQAGPIHSLGGHPSDGGSSGTSSIEDQFQAFLDSQNGGGGNALAKKRAKRDLASSFQLMVQSYGIQLSGNVQALIDQGVARKYSTDTFLTYLRDTPEYRQTFKGIFAPDGTMRMSESAYIQTMQDYGNVASQAGLNLTEKQALWNIRHDVTASEYADRASSIGTLNRNADMFEAFKKELVDNGVAKPGSITKKELQKFVLGQGNKVWTDLWQDAVTRNAAVQAGINFKKGSSQYLSLKENVIEKISGRSLSEAEMNQAFELASSALLTDLPAAHIQSLGLSKKQIVAAAFGGKGSAEARAKIDTIRKNAQAQDENTLAAGPAFVGEGGKLVQQGGPKEPYAG